LDGTEHGFPAGLVFDEDLLSERFAEPVRDDSRDDIGRSAGAV